jgi:hypothetical protein
MVLWAGGTVYSVSTVLPSLMVLWAGGTVYSVSTVLPLLTPIVLFKSSMSIGDASEGDISEVTKAKAAEEATGGAAAAGGAGEATPAAAETAAADAV